MNTQQRAEQFRFALQLYAASLPDDQKIQIATVFPAWDSNSHRYMVDDVVSHGTNAVGDPQLYRVELEHTSQPDWAPGTAPSLFTAIGITAEGYTVWAQPTGAHDAYAKGDIVDHNSKLYVSDIDGNVWEPGIYGWSEYRE